MTSEKLWLPVFGLALLLPGCLVAKSVGDDPETSAASDSDDADTEDTSGPSTAGSATSGSASATSTSGSPSGTSATATATSATGGNGDPLAACGIEPVPMGLPGYVYQFECANCRYDFTVPLPLENDEAVGECLCAADGCGEPFGGVALAGGDPGPHGPDYDGVCEIELLPNEGSGYYEQLCSCQTCEVTFEDVSEDTILSPAECDCVCLEAGCGYSEGGGGGVGSDGNSSTGDGGSTGDATDAGTGTSTSTTSTTG